MRDPVLSMAKPSKAKPAKAVAKSSKAAPAAKRPSTRKPAAKAPAPAKPRNVATKGKPTPASAASRGCPASDPFGAPCQNTPRLGSRYCGIHSHLG